MLSAILCRRSLLPNNSSCTSSSTILYNQFARRWKTTSKKKGKGKISFAKRKKLSLVTTADSSKKSTKPIIIDASKQSLLQSRGSTVNIEKARHMQQPKITQTVPSKVFTWVQANPFLPIVRILPTFTMGIIIWSRPEIWTNRPKFLGGTGGESDTKKMIPTEELPVYEEEEESVAAIEDDGKNEDGEWEMVDNAVTVPSTEQQEKVDEKPAVVDLLYAIGIRPHSSQ